MTEKLPSHALFDLQAIAASLPAAAQTLLIDTRLTDDPNASARVFRVYANVPAHYHATCDEYLLVLSGRGLFFIADQLPFEVHPGQLIHFRQGTIHGTSQILEEPLIFLAIDTPRRDPGDVIFVNPEAATAEEFIRTQP